MDIEENSGKVKKKGRMGLQKQSVSTGSASRAKVCGTERIYLFLKVCHNPYGKIKEISEVGFFVIVIVSKATIFVGPDHLRFFHRPWPRNTEKLFNQGHNRQQRLVTTCEQV